MAGRSGRDGIWDVAVVGAGHNGLVAAAALAQAGARVVVLEASERVGGAAITREIAPGYRVSSCAHLLYALSPAVVRGLDLARHGLALAATDLATVSLQPGSRPLVLPREPEKAAAQLAPFSRPDAARYPDFDARLKRYARALAPFLAQEPPALGGGWRDRWTVARLALAMRRFGKADLRDLGDLARRDVAGLLEETFETEALKGVLAFDATLGTGLGPRDAGSVLPLILRAAGEIGGRQGALALPRGGLGAVSDALAKAARFEGAVLRLATPVSRILVREGRACGILTASGEEVLARQVLSAADPIRTFRDLVDPADLDPALREGLRAVAGQVSAQGVAAKVNLALDGLPTIPGLAPGLAGGRLVLAPSLGFVEAAHGAARAGAISDMPALEILIPSIADPALAPPGGHVMSILAQWVPYGAGQGDWPARREALGDKVMAVLGAAMPDLWGRVVAREILTPGDLESGLGLSLGQWHGGFLSPDHLQDWGPGTGWARHGTPIEGLYLGGAGAHPGGGVTGLPGLVAARALLRDRVRAAMD